MIPHKLRFIGLLSSLWVMLAGAMASAHEVSPTIADLEIDGGELTLSLRINVEAFVAEINLDGLENTNATNEAERYDELRALPPETLAPMVEAFFSDWANNIEVEAAGSVPLSFGSVVIDPVGDIELPRDTELVLTGNVPDSARMVRLRWPEGAGYLVLRQQGVEEPYTGFLVGGEASPLFAIAGGGAQTGWQAFLSYIPVGFDHILPKGLDHILFVLALFFLSTGLRPLLWQITAFTLAHTVTLALGALGWVQVPAAIVEPLIAASIAFVAVENLFTNTLSRWRPLVVFGFGLLHGLGFASVLGEFGLPQDQFIPALIGFNIGVELGQLTVIAIAFLVVGYWFGHKPWYRTRIAMPASAVIALIGVYWMIERVFL